MGQVASPNLPAFWGWSGASIQFTCVLCGPSFNYQVALSPVVLVHALLMLCTVYALTSVCVCLHYVCVCIMSVCVPVHVLWYRISINHPFMVCSMMCFIITCLLSQTFVMDCMISIELCTFKWVKRHGTNNLAGYSCMSPLVLYNGEW